MLFRSAGAVHLFHLLKYGLSVVLIFVGLKMAWLNSLFNGHFPILLSLGIILGVIGASIVLSLVFEAARFFARISGIVPSAPRCVRTWRR